ncbi:hypothetical protein Lesp02_32990 [Lentzea sp. NBRC 105346]|uniref:hypothetical protein n=1 Tax=Lentzea sp. NBRC 105346 TaxID=3032205 RepID=UPI0024A07CA2|nr:hypothetical protein [Lentzea sp. NBRC 105346]GLZ31111.1 hypothetical protein Lesp02_32990 [Lentzea sp. NBRC 105346]
MPTRALVVFTLLFGVFAMHQVGHVDDQPGAELCLGLVVTVAGLVAVRKTTASGTTSPPPPARTAAVLLPRAVPVAVAVPTRLVVLRL